jgi:hypothetical protein
MVWVQQQFMENPPHCCARHMFGSLYLMNTDMEILLYASQYALCHMNCSWISLFSKACCRRLNCTNLPDAMINGVKHAGFQKSMLR